MIPNTGQLSVMMSKYDAAQQSKNIWKQERYSAMDYYSGNTIDYTSKYFSTSTLKKVVAGNINICKRVIDLSLIHI